jgi:hypothetical protein
VRFAHRRSIGGVSPPYRVVMRLPRFAHIAALAISLLLHAAAWAQDANATTAKPVRIAVIGASASAGFGCSWRETRADGDYGGSFRLADMLKLACPDLAIVTTDASSGFFFLSPVANGAKAAKRARDFNPDCVVALDFLFWYCYGDDAPDGGRLQSEADRLTKLERGLAELAAFDAPIVVGDIPDMSRAVGKMLSARQMPAPDTLAKANERFRAWAKERTNVRVVPLARMQRQLMEEGALEIGADRLVSTREAPLLQRDELHPTPQGLAGLACAVATEVKSALAAEDTPAGGTANDARDGAGAAGVAAKDALKTALKTAEGCEPDPADTIIRARDTLTRRPKPQAKPETPTPERPTPERPTPEKPTPETPTPPVSPASPTSPR